MGEAIQVRSNLLTRTPSAELLRQRRVRVNWMTLWSGLVVAIVGLAIVFPALLTTHNPLALTVKDRLKPPSAEHWFGTD